MLVPGAMRPYILRQASRLHTVVRLQGRQTRWASSFISASGADQQHLAPPSPKISRFDRRLSVLRLDRHGEVVQEETSIKELLLTTDMHVRVQSWEGSLQVALSAPD